MVKNIGYKGKDYPIDVDAFKVAPFAKNYIANLRRGKMEDTRGWLVRLEEAVTA